MPPPGSGVGVGPGVGVGVGSGPGGEPLDSAAFSWRPMSQVPVAAVSASVVSLRNPAGIRRHAQLAREVGAEWDEVLGTIMLTVPAFGMLAAVEAMPFAREGFDAAQLPEAD